MAVEVVIGKFELRHDAACLGGQRHVGERSRGGWVSREWCRIVADELRVVVDDNDGRRGGEATWEEEGVMRGEDRGAGVKLDKVLLGVVEQELGKL